ncbi:fibroin heavy chain [Spodoptera frugiperda]|uniref:Fibroin heavy chain n=1 Tax=Spodoptera frugiperda TaxID=7108 RepID=A0A9R0D704_SPOFR|nr:fibroin heavy chain [Spodoptera frugiperda]
MAAKFVVAVALVAMCRANPLLINGALYRDGRAFSIGQASSFGGGVSTAQANVNGDAAQAFGSSSGGAQLARDGYFYPGQAIAQAQTYDAMPFPESPYGGAKAVAQAHNGAYYPVPAPATVITYEQNFAVPAEASVKSTATSNGNGIAQSSANTQGGIGSYGVTSSNAKTQGFGSANSNANSGFGSASTSAKTQGDGSAESSAQNNSNGVVGVVYPVAPAVISAPAPSVIDAKSPIFYTPYAPAQGVASSNANVIGSGSAASSARVGHQGRTISWRFGTLYDSPASAQAQANTNAGYGAAKSAAHTLGYGAANANADVNGYGSAKSVADSQAAGHGIAQSSANSHGAGSAKANANVNGYNNARSGQYYGGSRLSADAHSHGFGNAASSARTQGVNTSFRVTNSQATSSGSGSAHANAHAA